MKKVIQMILRAIAFSLVIWLASANSISVLAHGGEDHGDSKPKTTTGEKGTVSHTARLGDFEVMVKHNQLEPDTATFGRLFITNFATNAPAEKVSPSVEIESENGAIIQIAAEKTDSAGSYSLKIPALAGGVYTLRAKITYSGETDTATFSGVTVENAAAASADGAGASWTRTALMIFIGIIVLSLLGGLIYFAARIAKGERRSEETVSV
jgi:hypothetical protein